MGVVLASAAGNYTDLGIKSLFEPILGLGTSYQFVRAAATAVERCQRIATLASFLAVSAGALTTDSTTNAAVGSAVASKIGYMKAILARGGQQEIMEYVLIPSLKNFAITANPIETPVVAPLLSPAQMQFHDKCNIITQNIFAEHTARRYAKGLAQKVVKPTLKPTTYPGPLASLALTKVSIPSLIGYSCLGIVISAIIIYGGLCMYRNANKKHYEIVVKANEQIIDVKAIDVKAIE
jgi:hypothetical protein